MYRNKVFDSYFWCCFLVLHFLAQDHEIQSTRIKWLWTPVAVAEHLCDPNRAFSLMWSTGMNLLQQNRVYITKELNSHRIGLGHQHGRRFMVLANSPFHGNPTWIRGNFRLKLLNSPKLPRTHPRFYCNANKQSQPGKRLLAWDTKCNVTAVTLCENSDISSLHTRYAASR